jgi:hypothetical protein
MPHPHKHNTTQHNTAKKHNTRSCLESSSHMRDHTPTHTNTYKHTQHTQAHTALLPGESELDCSDIITEDHVKDGDKRCYSSHPPFWSHRTPHTTWHTTNTPPTQTNTECLSNHMPFPCRYPCQMRCISWRTSYGMDTSKEKVSGLVA